MAEAGVDISGHQSKLVEDLPPVSFAYVITLCGHAHETCPYFPGRIIQHGFPDPSLLANNATSEEEILQAYRTVRDQIRQLIASLPQSLPERLPVAIKKRSQTAVGPLSAKLSWRRRILYLRFS